MKTSRGKTRSVGGFNSSPEGRLLLAISAAQPCESELDDLLRAKLFWPDILERAIACDLAPLLYHRLKNLTGARFVPPAVMNRLKTIYQWHAARNINLYAKLEEIRCAFAQEQIPLMLLKGAVLADLIYGNLALRPMRDLDILVRRNDFDVADSLLQSMGYVPDDSYEWNRAFHHNIPFFSADRSLIVELHHHIVPPVAPVSIPAEDLWQDARAVAMMNEKALMLAPEKFLLHLCVHLAYDDRFYRSLRALADIAATVGVYKEAIDWAKFMASVHAWKAERSVYYALWLAGNLVDADIPAAVLQGLAENKGNSRLSNFLIKRYIPRSISTLENQNKAVPAWVVRDISGQLLASDTARQSMVALSYQFPPRYVFTKLLQSFSRQS